ncbi:MAG: nucleotidyltransferase domain-containing protein [Clostridia bacterium]
MNPIKIINKFIKIMNYENDYQVFGVIFYGSYANGLNNKWSDLDLHILTKRNEHIQGRMVVDGIEIEYYERPYDDILNMLENDLKKNSTVIVSMLGYGNIILDKDGSIAKLQKQIIEKYLSYVPFKLSEEKAQAEAFSVLISMERLEHFAIDKDPYFNEFYYLTLDKIRRFYQDYRGFSSDISTSKVYKFYTIPKYSMNKFKILPETKFIELYNLAVINNEDFLNKFESINNLFKYSIKDFSFNLQNVRLKIK